MYFDTLKSMSETIRLSSVDLGRQAVVMFLAKKSLRGQTNTLLLFIHWFYPGYGPIKMESPFLNRSVPGAQQW